MAVGQGIWHPGFFSTDGIRSAVAIRYERCVWSILATYLSWNFPRLFSRSNFLWIFIIASTNWSCVVTEVFLFRWRENLFAVAKIVNHFSENENSASGGSFSEFLPCGSKPPNVIPFLFLILEILYVFFRIKKFGRHIFLTFLFLIFIPLIEGFLTTHVWTCFWSTLNAKISWRHF